MKNVNMILLLFALMIIAGCTSDDSSSDCQATEDGDNDDNNPFTDGDTAIDDDDDDNDDSSGTNCSNGPCLNVATEIDFGAVFYGLNGTKTLTLTSSGAKPLLIRDIFLSDATSSDFVIDDPTMPFTEPVKLEPSQTFTIQITYTRTDMEGDEGTLIISSDDVNKANVFVTLTNQYKGTAVPHVSTRTINFGAQATGSESESSVFTISNDGDTESNRLLLVNSITLGTGTSSAFVLHPEPVGEDSDSDCRTPFLLPSGAFRNCRVAFFPGEEGEFDDVININIKDRGEPDTDFDIMIQGFALNCTPGDNTACDDNNPCTVDVCTTEGACQSTNNDAGSCDDGNICTTDDRCNSGYCVGTFVYADNANCADTPHSEGCQVVNCDYTGNDFAGECVVETLPDGLTVCNDDPQDFKVCYDAQCIKADLKLSEVLYDADNGDNEKEWVEIYNASPVPLNLRHFQIGAGSDSGYPGYIYTGNGFMNGIIPPGGCYVVGGPLSGVDNANPDYDFELNFERDLQNINSSTSAGNGIGIFAIYRDGPIDLASVPIDTVIYGNNNDDDLVCPTGNPCPSEHVSDCGAGASIERQSDGNWYIQDFPTPGVCDFD